MAQDESDSNVNGRVLKLHFACHAELPYGSTLRVTSSNSLWASTAQTASGASPHSQAYDHGQGDQDSFDLEQQGVYASSVEMVTTPEDYPLWRTRTPVICVVNSSCDGIFKHKYRYLIVTPGAAISHDHVTETMTSDGDDGCDNVTEWEDPFSKATHSDDAKEV